MIYRLFRVMAWLSRVLPVRISYAVARAAGVAAYYLWQGGRRRCVRNMFRLAGGDRAAARRLARSSFAGYGQYLVDFLRFHQLSTEDLRDRVLFDHWQVLEEQRRGHGIVFVTMHVGNWDLGAAALALHGFPVAVIADTFADQRLNRLVLDARRHLGMTVVPAERMGPGILRALRRDEVVALLIDVPAEPAGGAEVEFFGETIAVPDGAARIALRSGASVVAAILPRAGCWSEQVRGEVVPVPFTPSGDADRDARALTQATMTALEGLLHRHPDQWYIFRSLWLADRRGAETVAG